MIISLLCLIVGMVIGAGLLILAIMFSASKEDSEYHSPGRKY